MHAACEQTKGWSCPLRFLILRTPQRVLQQRQEAGLGVGRTLR